MHLSVLITVFLCIVSLVITKTTFFRRATSYDNSACQLTTYWRSEDTPSSQSCAAICGKKEGCFSFFHNHNDGSCVAVGDILVPDPAACYYSSGNSFYTMSVYGAPCYYDSDCNPTETDLQCSEGRCKCTDFYNRVPNTRFCAADCDVYGDTFECYADMYLLFNNIEEYTSTDMSECQALCSSDSRCRSLDWIEESQECFLSDLTLCDYPENKAVSAIDTYCQRNCQ